MIHGNSVNKCIHRNKVGALTIEGIGHVCMVEKWLKREITTTPFKIVVIIIIIIISSSSSSSSIVLLLLDVFIWK